MIELLHLIYWDPWTTLLSTGTWQAYLAVSLYLLVKLVCGGWMLAKAGRSPVWVLLLLLPHAEVLLLWGFAYMRWPFVDRAAGPGAEAAEEEPQGPEPGSTRGQAED